jgi:hypothetical protein
MPPTRHAKIGTYVTDMMNYIEGMLQTRKPDSTTGKTHKTAVHQFMQIESWIKALEAMYEQYMDLVTKKMVPVVGHTHHVSFAKFFAQYYEYLIKLEETGVKPRSAISELLPIFRTMLVALSDSAVQSKGLKRDDDIWKRITDRHDVHAVHDRPVSRNMTEEYIRHNFTQAQVHELTRHFRELGKSSFCKCTENYA